MTAITKTNFKKLRSNTFHNTNERIYVISACLLLVIFLLLVTYYVKKITWLNYDTRSDYITDDNKKFNSKLPQPFLRNQKNPEIMNLSCNFFTCFNVYQCGTQGSKLLVYVYPFKNHTNLSNQMTREYYKILKTIMMSKYYTSNPREACIFVPSIDLLHSSNANIQAFKTLHSLEYWGRGENHLIFTTIPTNFSENSSDLLIGRAILVGAGLSMITYRNQFDVSLPIFSPLLKKFNSKMYNNRKWLLVLAQLNIDLAIKKDLLELRSLNPQDFKIFEKCHHLSWSNISIRCDDEISMYKYPDVLQSSTFCLFTQGDELGKSVLIESLATGCIPVVIQDSTIMPFEEVLDWRRAAIFIREVDILKTVKILKEISQKRIRELRSQGTWLFERYFKSIELVTKTTLEIISDRVFVHLAKNYLYWNDPKHSDKKVPLFSSITVPKSEGFTAVILTYDRLEFLFSLINKISLVPSLTKIIVIWNNQQQKPPKFSKWPKINKALKIIQTSENILSNRFYPYDEIETEAILSIDDDILMLTEDEVEFAFEVWREFPDRIVGFPSRIHKWDNKSSCWKYESEWTNEVSMVLTGAAFYHKYWNYAYTIKMPGDIKQWVDDHMNCEDIAMNFLVSNITGKAPIKVTAKKKFRCPECTNTEMLSADLTHMIERTQCINRFTEVFGYMPLMPVEFRADPVLYKDEFPLKLKRFNNIGSL